MSSSVAGNCDFTSDKFEMVRELLRCFFSPRIQWALELCGERVERALSWCKEDDENESGRGAGRRRNGMRRRPFFFSSFFSPLALA